MRYCNLIGGIVAALFALAPVAAHADTSGKSSAASAQSFTDVNQAVISLQLDKGKRRRIVFVHGTLSTNVTGTIALNAEIQGVALKPTFVSQTCSGPCSVSATWALDLDEGEAAHPGYFMNLQLFVEVTAFSDPPAPGEISFSTTMVKK